MDAAALMPPLPRRLVLFDGVCAVCDVYVQWMLDHDTDGVFSYAALQGTTARAIRGRHPELPDRLDSILYIYRDDAGNEHVYWYTDALTRIAGELPWPWRAAAALRVIPRPLRDVAYRAFAASRYALFGKIDQCRIPQPHEVARFLA